MTVQARGTTVVDVTYMCNARCRYCRWGDTATPGREDQDMEKILLPAKTLEALGTRRVVISGGEPMLHPKIADILGYYKKLVEQVVIITNGYGLDRGAVEDLLRAGATGITVSMDSVNSMESFLTRRTPPALHAKVLQNVAEIAGSGRKCELGINCTVSSVTANWLTVRDMLEFGESACLDFVKFQPVFDDGYVSANSSGLLLGPDDVDPLLEIASKVGESRSVKTNPPGFWRDVAAVAAGRNLPPGRCALGPSDSISVGGRLSICFWVESSCYGDADEVPATAEGIMARFEAEKRRCTVDFHCFCNQGVEHTWQDRAGRA